MHFLAGMTMRDALGRLGSRFEEVPLINGVSNFVKPKSLLFELDGGFPLPLTTAAGRWCPSSPLMTGAAAAPRLSPSGT